MKKYIFAKNHHLKQTETSCDILNNFSKAGKDRAILAPRKLFI